MSHTPPKTTRYCPICGIETKFEYNRNIGHSECITCGSRNLSSGFNQ